MNRPEICNCEHVERYQAEVAATIRALIRGAVESDAALLEAAHDTIATLIEFVARERACCDEVERDHGQ